MDVIAAPRKRGRPRKVIASEPEAIPEKPSRQKSTATNSKSTTAKKQAVAPKAAAKSPKAATRARTKLSDAEPKPIALSHLPERSFEIAQAASSSSRILEEVKSLHKAQETSSSAATEAVVTKSVDTMPSKSTKPSAANTSTTSVPPKAQSTPTQPTPSPKQLNAFAVNHLTGRAHPSRPQPGISDGKLPPNYKSVARKYTSVMVALPIAIVTSYMLWDRLVLGHEQKKLIRDTPDSTIEPATDLPRNSKA